ncbi:MAG TPA: hypothetical protein VGG99_25405 [Acetobacteraceae bacterium]|jgi:hypothetical protein
MNESGPSVRHIAPTATAPGTLTKRAFAGDRAIALHGAITGRRDRASSRFINPAP